MRLSQHSPRLRERFRARIEKHRVFSRALPVASFVMATGVSRSRPSSGALAPSASAPYVRHRCRALRRPWRRLSALRVLDAAELSLRSSTDASPRAAEHVAQG